MPLIILKCENWLEKLHRICAEFTKMMCIICKLHMHNCQFLVQNSDNPTVYVHSYGNTGVFTTLCIKFQA